MAVTPLPVYPLLNGIRPDWSSLSLELQGLIIRATGIKSLDYSDSLDPGEVRGTQSQVLATTLGTYSAEASIELYQAEHLALISRLGDGYMAQQFNINAKYSAKKGDPIRKDQIIGCRIKKESNSHSQSNEALTVKLDLHVMFIIRNGIKPTPDLIGY